MNYLITGGAGFIGSQLAYRLHKMGHKITLLDDMSYGHFDNLRFDDGDLMQFLEIGNVRDAKTVSRILSEKSIDVIFHIAGIAPLPDCQSDPCKAVDVNVNGTVNVLECARRAKIRKVVFASTNAMYENAEVYPTKESDLNFPTLIYPNTKYCAERFAQSFCDTYGMSVTCVRFANVYGPHIDCLRKQPPFVAYMIREMFYDRVPEFYSTGDQKRDYVYVDDLVRLLIEASKKLNGFDTVNCCSMKNYSVREMHEIAKKIMSKSIDAHYNESSDYWLKYPELYEDGLPISKKILEHEVNKTTLCDNSHAFNEYGWKPEIDIEEGLRRMAAYICEKLEKLG